MTIEELEVPDRMKAEEISQLFEQHLSKFYSSKNQELKA
jgi:hypothetical protein